MKKYKGTTVLMESLASDSFGKMFQPIMIAPFQNLPKGDVYFVTERAERRAHCPSQFTFPWRFPIADLSLRDVYY